MVSLRGFENDLEFITLGLYSSTSMDDSGTILRYTTELDDGSYTEEQIINVNETGLFWKQMPNEIYPVNK